MTLGPGGYQKRKVTVKSLSEKKGCKMTFGIGLNTIKC